MRRSSHYRLTDHRPLARRFVASTADKGPSADQKRPSSPDSADGRLSQRLSARRLLVSSRHCDPQGRAPSLRQQPRSPNATQPVQPSYSLRNDPARGHADTASARRYQKAGAQFRGSACDQTTSAGGRGRRPRRRRNGSLLPRAGQTVPEWRRTPRALRLLRGQRRCRWTRFEDA